MRFYIDEFRLGRAHLSPRAQVLAEVIKAGAKVRPFDAKGFDAVLQLIDADVLRHPVHATREEKLRNLAEMIGSDDATS